MKGIDVMNMKKILFALGAMLLAGACEEKENLEPLGNWEIAAPVPMSPAPDTRIVLDESAPDEAYTFEWEPATTTNRFGVAYTLLLVPKGSDDLQNPVLRVTPANSGKSSTASVTAEEVDYALWAACYPAGAEVELEWVVVARAIDKEAPARRTLNVKRFETERVITALYISGAGTEAGADASNATPMRSVPDANGDPSGVFEVYTTLTQGGTFTLRDRPHAHARVYGGADGTLEACGDPIAVSQTAQYRVTVDVINNTFTLLRIDRWSLVGGPLEGGWDGDVPLNYEGNGVWSGEVEFFSDDGFLFRANGDWAFLYKRIVGTATGDNKGGALVMESEGNSRGVEFEDIPGFAGLHMVTLDLNAEGGYTYTLVEVDQGPVEAIIGETGNPDGDKVSGSFGIEEVETPESLYLISGGAVVAEFTKDGDVFTTTNYIALEASKQYILNTASDGSGEEVVTGDIGVARDQAYKITVDFASGKLQWTYYNLKLFHWDEVGGGWDSRQELLMTYVHPYTFEVSGNLSAGYHSKFISPWDIQFGTADKALSGTMTNGGDNFAGITQNGTYKATIVVSPDFATAEYSFVKQ